MESLKLMCCMCPGIMIFSIYLLLKFFTSMFPEYMSNSDFHLPIPKSFTWTGSFTILSGYHVDFG